MLKVKMHCNGKLGANTIIRTIENRKLPWFCNSFAMSCFDVITYKVWFSLMKNLVKTFVVAVFHIFTVERMIMLLSVLVATATSY